MLLPVSVKALIPYDRKITGQRKPADKTRYKLPDPFFKEPMLA